VGGKAQEKTSVIVPEQQASCWLIELSLALSHESHIAKISGPTAGTRAFENKPAAGTSRRRSEDGG